MAVDATNPERARRAYAALQRSFAAEDGSGLYRETTPPTGRRYSYLWPFSQVFAAAMDLAEGSPELAADVRTLVDTGLPKYWDATAIPPGYDAYVVPPHGDGSDKYYDDNAWIGLCLVRAARVSGNESMVDAAWRVFRFLASGWDADSTHPFPGGVFWTQARNNRDRNTVSNGPPAELALRLHQLTGNDDYRLWATRMYDWVNATLRDPADGLYWDHVSIGGVIDTTKWTYNQGSMAAVAFLLDDVDTARAVATAALRHYAHVGYFGQDPAFNAIFFRNLHTLADAAGDEPLRRDVVRAMQEYADTAWEQYRTVEDLFVFESGGPARVIDQGALVQ